MSTMKNISYILIAILASALIASCSLEEERTSFVNRENAYGTVTQCKSVLNSCYDPLADIVGASYFLMTENCNDLWYGGPTSIVDSYLNISPSNPGIGSSIWDKGYFAVMCCNECVECISASELPDEEKMPLAAEARALRALYYYVLTCTFGDVPFYTCMVEDVDVMKEICVLPRRDASEIRAELYADLRDNALPWFTQENGLKARPSEIAGNRAGYALSLMLMAKFAMWNKDWEAALVPLELMEQLYGPLTEERYPLEHTQWRFSNVHEGIYEIQHAYSTTGVKYSSGIASVCLPVYKDNLFDGVAIEGLGTNISSGTTLRATSHFTSIFKPLPLKKVKETINGESKNRYYLDLTLLDKVDKRIQYMFAMGNLETGETFEAVKGHGRPSTGPKFWCPDMISNKDYNNYPFFRYADAVLMMAEVLACMENADLAKATEYLNQTRVRAGIKPLDPPADKETFMTELINERARELGGEMHRKFDLVRWGIWYERTLEYTHNSKVKDNIMPCHEYYPIPDEQCALGNYVLTNDAYTSAAAPEVGNESEKEDENETDSATE